MLVYCIVVSVHVHATVYNYSTYLDYAGIPFPFPTPMSAAILAAILEFTFIRYFFHPENDFNGFLESRTLTQKPM